MNLTPDRCRFPKCRRRANNDSDYCPHHQPDRVREEPKPIQVSADTINRHRQKVTSAMAHLEKRRHATRGTLQRLRECIHREDQAYRELQARVNQLDQVLEQVQHEKRST